MTGIDGSPRRHAALAGLAILCAGLAAYHNSFSGPLVLDDLSSIAGNPTIRRLWPLTVPLAPPHGGGLTVEGRPLLNLSFALNYALGGTRVWGYHVANLAIHLLAGLTLFGLIRRTLLRREAPDVRADATLLAALAAMLWTVHPLATESVTYLAQRAESLMGLFYLLTLYCFVRAVQATDGFVPRATNGGLWFFGSFFACLLGMGTKEVMVSAPITVFVYDRVFVAGGWGEAWRRRRGYYLGLAATWILLGWLVAGAGNRGGTSGWGSGVAAPAYWLTQPAALAHYLRLAAWPHPLIFDYGTGWGRSMGDRLGGILVALALVGATIWAGWRRPAVGFLSFLFLVLLAPTSLVPGNRQTLAEHRMYLALAPLAVLAVMGSYRVLGPRLAFALWPLVALGFLLLTVRRNRVYRSALELFADNVAHCPGNAFAECNLGTALDLSGRTSEAVGHLEKALRIRPDYPIARANLGNALLRVGRVDAAVGQFEAALRLEPGLAEADDNLGNALALQGRTADAIDRYRLALRLRPAYADAHYDLGNALAHSGRAAEAVGEFVEALRCDPGYLPAQENLGNALLRQGRAADAVEEYRAVLRVAPGRPVTHYNLGQALLRQGQGPEAAAQFREALRLQPDFPAARAALDSLPP